MAAKSLSIKFTEHEVNIIEKYRVGRRLGFGPAVKELIHIADGAINDGAQSSEFADFIALSKRLNIETLMLLRYFISKADPELYKKAQIEFKEVMNSQENSKG